MISAGIDIGSRTIKVVTIKDNIITAIRKAENSFDTLKKCNELLEGLIYDRITSTGYGRNLFAEKYGCSVISEIKAFAMGAKFIYPVVKTILDIGGQDTKAISIDENGRLKKFEMNDKCAAGTGRFIEIMAMALGYNLNEFSDIALSTEESVSVSSMCTVFAESEVVSMIAKGAERAMVARGIHQSIVNRSISLLKRVSDGDNLFFAGGVAYNKCIVHMLGQMLRKEIIVPKDPQITGALGAALFNEEL